MANRRVEEKKPLNSGPDIRRAVSCLVEEYLLASAGEHVFFCVCEDGIFRVCEFENVSLLRECCQIETNASTSGERKRARRRC